jgi:glycerol-3-phosphate O-acyltransferase
VCARINRVTPITPTSLVTFALLSSADRALTLAETHSVVQDLVLAVQRRRLPTTTALDLDQLTDVQAALDALVDSGVVTPFKEGPEAVYLIAPEQQLTAAYYRNTIIHFFVNGAIIELALLATSEVTPDAQRPTPYDVFWDEVYRLRDLFKFEFFFADKDEHRGEIAAELALFAPDWKTELAEDRSAAAQLLRRIRPYSAYSVLRPFAEAYRVVADALTQHPSGQPLEDGPFLVRCLALGKQYHLQRRIRSAESVSKILFETALRLVRNRGLITGQPGDDDRCRAFANELRDVVRRLDAIEVLAAARSKGLVT